MIISGCWCPTTRYRIWEAIRNAFRDPLLFCEPIYSLKDKKYLVFFGTFLWCRKEREVSARKLGNRLIYKRFSRRPRISPAIWLRADVRLKRHWRQFLVTFWQENPFGCRAADVHIVQLLFVHFPPVDGRAGGAGPSNLSLAQRRYQQHQQGPVHVRQTTQPLLKMDSRRYISILPSISFARLRYFLIPSMTRKRVGPPFSSHSKTQRDGLGCWRIGPAAPWK